MKRSALLGVVGLISLALSPLACRRNNYVATVAPPAQVVVGMTLTASVQDAKTSALLPGVTLLITGKDANAVVDGSGNSLFKNDTSGGAAGPISVGAGGIAAIALHPSASATYPLSLTVVATASGYSAASALVSVDQAQIKSDGTGNLPVAITMNSIAAPAPTVSTVTTTATTSTSGATTAPVSATTPAVTATVNGATVNLGSAAVAIPTSTIGYTDATQTTPLTGTLNVVVVYNNNTTPESLATYPGNMTSSVAADGTALTTPGLLVPGALVTVSITDGAGHEAHSFTNPLAVSATITGNTPIADGSRQVKAGDSIPIWTYDESRGTWNVQRDASNQPVSVTLGTADADGNFPVSFQTLTLSKKAPGFVSAHTISTITVKGGQGLGLDVVGHGIGWQTAVPEGSNADPASFSVSLVPKGRAGTWRVYSNGGVLQSFASTDLSVNATLDVTAAATAYLNTHGFATATVHVTEVCSTNPAPPSDVNSTLVTAYSPGLPVVSGTTSTSGGVATLSNLQVGKTYTITTNSRRTGVTALTTPYTVVSGTNTIPEQRFTISCSGATGATGGQ
jgi:hypothetical protein